MKKDRMHYSGLYRGQPKNVNIQNTAPQKEGYYVGSATNMARLFIFIITLFSIVMTGMGFYIGHRIGALEKTIEQIQSDK